MQNDDLCCPPYKAIMEIEKVIYMKVFYKLKKHYRRLIYSYDTQFLK